MTQFAHPTPKCQAALAPFGSSDVRLDVEVLAERYEALAALSPFEDDPPEEPDEAEEEEALDDLPSSR